MQIGRTRIKGIYYEMREAYLRNGRSRIAALKAANRALRIYDFDVTVNVDEGWYKLMMWWIERGRSWAHLATELDGRAQEDIIIAVRGWQPLGFEIDNLFRDSEARR